MPVRADYVRPMRDMGILKPNRKIEGASSPDHVGEAVINDVPYRISLWDDPKGTKTISFQPIADYS